MPRPPAPCGTYGGYQRHRKAGEKACEPCNTARREYMDTYRQDPDVAAKNRAEVGARSRALRRLAAEYPDRFAELLHNEKAHLRTSGDSPQTPPARP